MQADSGGYHCILPSCVSSLWSVVSHFGLCCCLHSNLWEPVQGAKRQLATLSVCVFRAEDIPQSEQLVGKSWIVCCYGVVCTGYKASSPSWMLLLHASMYSIVCHLYFTLIVVYSLIPLQMLHPSNLLPIPLSFPTNPSSL